MPAFRTALISTSVLTASVLSLALTGCQSSSSTASGGSTAEASSVATSSAKSAGTSGTTSAAGTPGTASAATPAQGKLASVPKSCPSADEVMSKLGLSKLVVHGADPSFCEYLYQGNNADPYVAITFSAAPPSITPGSFQDQLKQAQSGVKAVAGLADAADTFTGSGGGSGLSFLSGGTICSIVSSVPTTTAGKVALARSIIAG
jgi:hypothetical protein